MKSSKKLAMLLTALTMCSSVALVAACQTTEDHTEHSYDWTLTTPPTCTEAGVETGTCECGETTTRPVDPIGHDYEWTVTTEPTCEGKGVKTGVCKNDETHTATEDVDPTGHDYEWAVTTPATCEGKGVKTGVCKNDETHTTTQDIDPTGHDYEWTETTAPTCTEAGEESGVCKNDETHTTTREVPATGHTPDEVLEVLEEATCLAEGSVRVRCADCGEEYTMITPKTDHKWGEWIVDNEGALCTDETSKTHTCEICHEEESRVVPPTEHRYADWSVKTAATCTEDGLREHTCVSCGHHEEQVIDATGHHYTDWQVTNPTENTTGLAKKVCAGDKELDHVKTVTLPLLTDSSYKVEEDSNTGVKTYTLTNADGDIIFKVYEINGVADAVDVAFKTQSQVIKATVDRDNVMVTENGPQPSSREIVYELGVNYAHIKDGSEKTEYFYSLNEDGTLFPVMHSLIGNTAEGEMLVSKDVTATVDSLNGYGYSFTFMMGGNKYYGTGSIINYLYTVGSNNSNKDFEEGTKIDDNGNTVYYFTYGMIYGKYFDVVYAEFSLDSSYIVSDAELNVKTYVIKESAPPNDGLVSVNDPLLELREDGHWWYDGKLLISSANQETSENPGSEVEHTYTYPEEVNGYVDTRMYIDTDGTPRMRAVFTATYEQLPNGTYRVVPGMEDQWANSETYFISQKTQLDSGETLPTNPYNYEDFIISSFTLQHGGEIIEEGTEFEIDAKGSVVLTINNVLPSTYNPYFDSFDIYLIDDMGNEIAANSNIVNVQDGEIGYFFFAGNDGSSITKDYSITIKSLVAGEWDLKIVTVKHTFTIHLVVNYIAPDPLYTEVYQVNDVTGKSTWNKTLTSADVYENQSLVFRTAVDHPAYESSRVNVTVTKDGENVTTACLTVSAEDGLPVYTFRGAEVGTYYITVASELNSGRSVTLTVTVNEAPDVSEMLDGIYGNDDLGYTVEFQPDTEGALSGKAIIVKGFAEDGEDKLQTTTITYSYDPATRTFTSEYKSGASGDFVQGVELPYNYSFELSEAYKLYLTYESGFDGSIVKVLIGGVQNSLVCKDAMITAKSIEYADKLTANVSGTYTITATSSTFIAVNGVQKQIKDGKLTDEEADYSTILPYISGGSVTLDLYIGDYIQIWNGISTSPTYSIELIEEFKTVLIEGLDFDQESAEVREGETLVLKPVFTPEDTTQRGLIWTTSNASIATVDDNGFVTGVSAGTVTITAKSSNGRYSATIEITVIGANVLNLGENTLTFTTYTANVEYVFEGEADKAYTVNITCSGNMGAQISYNGAVYYASVKLDIEGGTTKLIVSAFSYYTNNVVITITEKTGAPETNFDALEVGTTTVDIYPNYIYYTIVGEPGAKYTVTVGPDATLYGVINGNVNYGNNSSKTMEYTADANGFADICFFPGQGPGVYTIKVEKTGGGASTNFDALNADDTAAPTSSGYTFYTLVGDPNTTYTLSATDLTFYNVVDGDRSNDGFKSGSKDYTTDENGHVDICVYRGGNPAGNYTIVITKVGGGTVDPDPDPEPTDENVIEVGEGLVLENLDTTGVTLTLGDSCEWNKNYQLVVYDADMETISSDVIVMVGDRQGNPIEFKYYGMMTGQVTVAAKNGTISELYVDLQEYLKEIAEVTLDQEVTVSGADEDYFDPAVYKIDLAAGYYNIYVGGEKLEEVNGASDVAIAVEGESDYEVIDADDGNVAINTAGTYYVLAYFNDLVFKIEKNDELGVPEPPVTPDPNPNPGGSYTVTAKEDSWQGTEITIDTLDENGVTIVIEGCIQGKSYSVYSTNKNWSMRDDVDVIMEGEEITNNLTFTATESTQSVVVRSNNGNLSEVVITVYTN